MNDYIRSVVIYQSYKFIHINYWNIGKKSHISAPLLISACTERVRLTHKLFGYAGRKEAAATGQNNTLIIKHQMFY